MEIERVNENTVKFYISYIDIEDRGFKREEIWYNREKSEQLFWQMMEEVNYKEDFTVEGPLWIQVQALEKGLEVIVTKAQVSKNGEHLVLPTQNDNKLSKHTNEQIETLLNNKFGKTNNDEQQNFIEENQNTSLIVHFTHFEDVIQLSHYCEGTPEETINTLYYYRGKYYLYVEFLDSFYEDTEEDLMSQIYEFADDSNVTIHLLEAYGKRIFENDTFNQVRSYFSAQV